MNLVQLIEGLEYPEQVHNELPEAFKLTIEICARLQELDECMPGTESNQAGGIRFISRISAIARKSPRAYRLLIDMLSYQDSFSMSIEQLASRHLNSNGLPISRQAWLQKAQFDVELVKGYWPEVGECMEELLKRRPQEDASV